jgi:type VII secretion protein EccB
VPRPTTTWLHVSGHRFHVRRIERALLREDIHTPGRPVAAAWVAGCALAAAVALGCAVLAVLRPEAAFDQARIVMGRESGALFVRVGDSWHPVLNLASARLIAASADTPRPVPDAALGRTKRGSLLGIPGAPQQLAPPLPGGELDWTICDADTAPATTVVVGPVGGTPVRQLGADEAALVVPGPTAPAYLLHRGRRAVVDLADPAVLHALGLEGRAPRVVSQALLNAVPEAPPIKVPRIRGAGGAVAWLPGHPVGSVLRITGEHDQYYVVLAEGVQRIGRVAAEMLRFADSQHSTDIGVVAPDAIRGAPVVDALPVSTLPDRVTDGALGDAICATWADGTVSFLTGGGPPVPAGRALVRLTQADGRGPAVDAVYVRPGSSAYVRATPLLGPSSRDRRAGTRYLVTDAGVRFAVHDDDAAHDLGLPSDAAAAPWSVLALLPSGPELSRANASVARDTVAAAP